jgi:ABC-type uncharacterized transport system ATPase subunit
MLKGLKLKLQNKVGWLPEERGKGQSWAVVGLLQAGMKLQGISRKLKISKDD